MNEPELQQLRAALLAFVANPDEPAEGSVALPLMPARRFVAALDLLADVGRRLAAEPNTDRVKAAGDVLLAHLALLVAWGYSQREMPSLATDSDVVFVAESLRRAVGLAAKAGEWRTDGPDNATPGGTV